MRFDTFRLKPRRLKCVSIQDAGKKRTLRKQLPSSAKHPKRELIHAGAQAKTSTIALG